MKLSDIVKFRGDLLFNGAVQIEWFESAPDLSAQAVKHFVFHGPEYHGVSQADITVSDDHTLIDTASFTREILGAINDRDRQGNPFALAIAGYGTGKSHLGLTLSSLLSSPEGESASAILDNLESADPGICSQVSGILNESNKPYLVLAINGMNNFDLAGELSRQVLARVREMGADPSPIEQLQPRFQTALGFLNVVSDSVLNELTDALNGLSKAEIAERLEVQDESVFVRVAAFFEQRSMPIVAVGRESIQELLDVTCSSYCGSDGPFRELVIIFDEFGRYAEFATLKSQVAGSGVLQQLFEGVQKNSEKALFLGLIQFELNAYLERIAPEFKNDITRVITRYQTSRKYYLSVNLETLLAHTIEKRNPEYIARLFEEDKEGANSEAWIAKLTSWFPQMRRHSLWCDPTRFRQIIQQGCWPLSPAATWLLYHLTSSGKYLQQRSALTILDRAFERVAEMEIPEHLDWTLSAAELWSEELQTDLLSAEEYGKQGAVVHAYATVCDRYQNRFSEAMMQSLRAIVLAAKMGLTVSSQEEAVEALSVLSGLQEDGLAWAIQELQNEYNVVEWDDSFKQFEIIGDAVPRTQFLAFLRNRVGSSYDSQRKAGLFASKASEWCDLLEDVDTDFGAGHNITTTEWHFETRCSNTELLETHLAVATQNWHEAFGVGQPRGQLIYYYVGPESDLAEVSAKATRYLKGNFRQVGASAAPILVVMLHDDDDKLGQALAEYAVLNESMTAEEKSRFGNFILGQQEKCLETIRTQVSDMIRQRCYVSCWDSEQIGGRLRETAAQIFENLYTKPIPFPFDGFHTPRGNAADDCQLFIRELLTGKLDHAWYTSQPARIKNRADSVLNECWQAISQDGSISRRPRESVVGNMIRAIDSQLQQQGVLNLGELTRKYCRPPFGGNIASVGLFLGVFVAPRHDKLVVEFDGQTTSFEHWLQHDVFRGKYLSLDILDKTTLMLLSQEVSEEWENLLAEWEQMLSHKERADYLLRGEELKSRLTLPPSLGWKYQYLEEQSTASINALRELDRKENEELEKLEKGYERQDVNLISWAGAEIVKLRKKMEEEEPLWTTEQVQTLNPNIERSRQAAIQFFEDWVSLQVPMSGKPDDVGKFRHRMLDLVRPNLNALELPQLAEEVEKRTSAKLRNVERIIAAKQLIGEINTWIDTHDAFSPMTKVAELDEYLKTTSSLNDRLVAQRINLPQLAETQKRLNDFTNRCNKTRQAHMKRAGAVWNRPMKNREDVEDTTREVNALSELFAGRENDLEDFLVMQKVLMTFSQDYERLSNLRLSWNEFGGLCDRLMKECLEAENDEGPPWEIEEVYGHFRTTIRSQRISEGTEWMEDIKAAAADISALSVTEANRLLGRIETLPPYLTEEQSDEAKGLQEKIERHLNALALEWLLERFQALPLDAKQEFLRLATDLLIS